jgi:uncharacterized membrane protein
MFGDHQQKLAAIRLTFGLGAMAVIGTVLAQRGVETYFADAVTRAWVVGVGGLAALMWAGTAAWSARERARGAVLQDERDVAIMLRSSRITLAVTNVYVLAGAVVLTETYLGSNGLGGCVPTSCVFVFAMSVLFTTFVGQALATLTLYLFGSSHVGQNP